MFSWHNPYDEIDIINHDHNYSYTENQLKNLTKKYYFKSQLIIHEKSKSNIYVEIDVDSENGVEFQTNLLNVLVQKLSKNVVREQEDKNIDLYFNLNTNEKPLLYSDKDFTVSEVSLRCKLYQILDEGVNSLSICPPINNDEYIINFQNIMRNISKRICRTFGACHWRMDICSLAHCSIIDNAPIGHLCVYVEIFRLLHQRNKFKTILNQLHIWAQNQKLTNVINWSNFLDYLLSDKPCYLPDNFHLTALSGIDIEFNWELDDKLKPIIIHIYTERWFESKRMITILEILKKFANIVEFRFDDSGRLRKKFEALRSLLQSELKSRKTPIFVMGWDLGSLLAMLSSIKLHHHTTSTVLCGIIGIGVPLKGLKGERGVIPEDYIHLLSRDTLVISGDLSRIGNGDDMEEFKERLGQRVGVRCVSMGGCDKLLRLSHAYAMRYRLNQTLVDVQILKEVKRFIVDRVKEVFMNPEKTTFYHQHQLHHQQHLFSSKYPSNTSNLTDNSAHSLLSATTNRHFVSNHRSFDF